ncbi:MAG: carboxypeptidase-like regulatory domain-containing protein [Flavipsychrobacter sp.]|nr:carboxypeptidase-like regulatory domain-containing protein [Flavipsychrobacter sp.]
MPSRCLNILILLLLSLSSRAQLVDERIVQINGVIMTADSLRGVSNAVVLVKNKNRGVESSQLGVFSIVCFKGDTLQFNALGFRQKEYVVPRVLEGQYFSLIQLMVQDTFYLPETIIRPFMTREQFDYAFRNNMIPDDQYEIARKNTDLFTLRALAMTLPKDGRESQAMYQQQQFQKSIYYGQMPNMKIFDPIAWGEFFQAWKRGDFRKKKY